MATVARAIGNHPFITGLLGAIVLAVTVWFMPLNPLLVLVTPPLGFLLGVALAMRLHGPETDHTTLERAVHERYDVAARQADIPHVVSSGSSDIALP